MSRRLMPLDLNQLELQNAVLQVLATAPTTPKLAQMYYNSANTKAWICINTVGPVWQEMDGIGATMTPQNIVDAINGSALKIDDDNLSTVVNNAIAASHSHSNKSTLDAIEVAYTTALNTKMTGIESLANVTDAGNVGPAIFGQGAKATPIDADQIAIIDSASSNALAKVTWAQVKATLKTYNDTLYNLYVHPNHTGDVTSVADGATTIGANKVLNSMLAQMVTMTIKGNNTGSTATPIDLTKTQVQTLLNVADGANNYVHPSGAGNNHIPTAGATSNFLVYGGSSGTSIWALMDDTLHGSRGGAALHAAVTTSVNGFMIAADKTKLDGVAASANNYVHPSGDGNLHVPVNGTTNSGHILTAGAAAGVYTWAQNTPGWADIVSKPSSSAAAIDAAVTASHTQNTDTGTSSATFMIGTGGPKLKNVGGEIQARNNADNAFADFRCNAIFFTGSTFQIDSNVVNIGDNKIELNTDVTTSAMNSDGGLNIKRLKSDNTTRADAEMVFNNTTGKWQVIDGDVASALVTSQIARKLVASIGDGAATSYVVTHNLNTQDIVTGLRESASPFALVETDIEFTSANTLTIKFAVAPTAGQYSLTMVG